MKVQPGSPYPLGATWDGRGVNFSIFSEHASGVELCLFDSPADRKESARIRLTDQTDMVWHCYLQDVLPGQLYGYRVEGVYDSAAGRLFNPVKILLDPYAKGVGRTIRWHPALYGHYNHDIMRKDARDSAPYAPLGCVIDTAFTWGDDRPPKIPWHKTIIYETHVKGFTHRLHDVPESKRGKYAGMASEPAIEHLLRLGVTSVELMPVHHHANDQFLVERELKNYWGYDTLAFFAPDTRYSVTEDPNETVREFKVMVRKLHAAGLEVILDVVYNHTAEGNALGPTLSLRGIDNAAYYRLVPGNPAAYMDFTGCGNTLNMQHPRVLQLIMDSLRYWVLEMHVDGFRFDLASALARELYDVDKLGAFFDIIHQDPVISQVKLIAEPWDLGAGGYQVGNFPVGWTEWNGKYRDTVRRFWKGEGGVVSELATRLAGSSDLYEQSGRRPYASINFVTAHDGFTLQDLVSYDRKHNDANGENNADGESNNLSWNCGVEGPTNNASIRNRREKQKRNFLATLMLSQGVPMICGGDEIGRTQQGNNNAYCQDNEISWYDWDLTPAQRDFLEFVRYMVQIQKDYAVLRRRKFFQGRSIRGAGVKDIAWFRPRGVEMDDRAWNSAASRCLGVRLSGHALEDVDEEGNIVAGDTLFLMFNAGPQTVPFSLPKHEPEQRWERLLDTADANWSRRYMLREPRYRLQNRSVVVLRIKQLGTSRAAMPPRESEDT